MTNNSRPDAASSMSLLLKDWTANEQEIARRIQVDYFPRLRQMSQRLLQGIIGANVEADDVVQSAIMSFCLYMRGKSEEPGKGRDDVWRLLCRIAARKASRRRERQTRGRRDVRLFSTTDVNAGNDSESIEENLEVLSTDEFDLIIHDAIEQLDESLRPIALMVMQGKSQQEISEALNVSRRTVIRKFDLVKRLLSSLLEDEL